MARPRKDQAGPDARTRIIDAFWGMLADGPYERITVRGLASRARVNHNTIYRHFDSIDHVARTAIEEVYSIEAAMQVIALFAHPELLDTELLSAQGLDKRFNKVLLAMRSDSPMLVSTIRESIKTCWMQIVGFSWDELPEGKKLELSFILGGVTSMLGTFQNVDDILSVKVLVSSRIGNAARQTLAELSAEMR